MAVRIQSDGTVARIMDSETKERVKGIGRIEIVHDIGAMPVAELQIVSNEPSKYDVTAEPTFWAMSTVAGEMKQVKKIEFEDGEIISYGGTQ